MGLSDITGLARKTRRNFIFPIHRHQGFFALDLSGVNNQLAVGRKAWFLIGTRVTQRLRFLGAEVHQIEFELATLPGDVGQPFSIRTQTRRNVVSAIEGHPGNGTAFCRHSVNLGGAAPVAHEINGTAIGHERGLGVNAAGLREALGLTSSGRNQIDL